MRVRTIASSVAAVLLLTVTILATGALTVLASSGQTTRVSTATGGTQGTGDSLGSAVSSDGHYVVFASGASNLVTGDTNFKQDVFVKNTVSGATTRVSTASNGTQANGVNREPGITADGGLVVFRSDASNLVTGDTNFTDDIFVKNIASGETTRVSTSSNGTQADNPSFAPRLAANGRYVVFQSMATNLVSGDTNNTVDVFIKDLTTGETRRVSTNSSGVQADGYSYAPSVSADGRYVAFESDATNLVTGDTNGVMDVFVKDLTTGTTTRVSTTSSNTQGGGASDQASISSDGRYVAFRSQAADLVANDTNVTWDIFVKDRTTNATTRVNTTATGVQTATGTLSYMPFISADGNYVVFQSDAATLVTGDTNSAIDVFVKDRASGAISRASVSSTGVQGDAESGAASLSADGGFIVFESAATNLVTGDTNGKYDIFAHESGVATVTPPPPPTFSGTLQDSVTSAETTVALSAGQKITAVLSKDPSSTPMAIKVLDPSMNELASAPTTVVASAETTGNYHVRVERTDGLTSPVSYSATWTIEWLPTASLGAPTKDAGNTYSSVSFTATGTVSAHSFPTTVTIECSKDKTAILNTYTSIVGAGATTYSAGAVTLPSAGTWYMRAKHQCADHRTTYSSWTTVVVTDLPPPPPPGSFSGTLQDSVTSAETTVTLLAGQKITAVLSKDPSSTPMAIEVLDPSMTEVASSTVATVVASADTTGNYHVRIERLDGATSPVSYSATWTIDWLPTAALGAPTKAAGTTYSWASFTATGAVSAHSFQSTVTIECSKDKTAILNTYTTTVATGSATYSAAAVKLPSSGTWYMRAKHQCADHLTTYSEWTTVVVSGTPIMSAPKGATTMYTTRTYTFYGTIKPRHTSTYIYVKAYKLVGSSYVYKTHFHVKTTTIGQPSDTTKWTAAIKLTTKGGWKLRLYHVGHGGEVSALSGYSSKITVK